MDNLSINPKIKSPWIKLILLMGFLFTAVSIGGDIFRLGIFIKQVTMALGTSASAELIQQVADSSKTAKEFIWLKESILGSIFIVALLLYWRSIEQTPIKDLFPKKKPYRYFILLTIGLVVSFMIIKPVFIEWNMGLKLPAFLAGFEQWALAKEAELQIHFDLITTFDSYTELFIGIFVIAIIPAIGEELLFRGILQNLFHAIIPNIHWAIGITAFVFSAIHLQFHGLLLRFLFGALFGYIYWWTKDLSLSMIAHFFNNAFILVLKFLQQKAWIQYDLENLLPPTLGIILLFSILMLIFANTLRRLSRSS